MNGHPKMDAPAIVNPAIAWSTNMKGVPKINPRPAITETGSSTAQTRLVKMATASLISHWRRADVGSVMCQECVPDVLSSHNERLTARIAINGVTRITGAY